VERHPLVPRSGFAKPMRRQRLRSAGKNNPCSAPWLMFYFCSLLTCAPLEPVPAATNPAMIRAAFAIALCLATAGCQSDVSEETYDANHPFDRAMTDRDDQSTIAGRARTNLETHVGVGEPTAALARRFLAMRIACKESGRTLRCVYRRNHSVTGKGLVTRLRWTFIADIDLRRRADKVWQVCIESEIVDPPPREGRIQYAPMCDTAKLQ
jgi:hypothetical protein